MERYRSGHNEAVLKTVCPQGRVGSNPTLSVIGTQMRVPFFFLWHGKKCRHILKRMSENCAERYKNEEK